MANDRSLAGPVPQERTIDGVPNRIPLQAALSEIRHFLENTAAPSPPIALLAGYAELIRQEMERLTPELETLTATHLRELMVLAQGRRGSIHREVPARRLESIKTYIASNFERADLSLQEVSSRHFVSPRYVQALFKKEGMTFRSFLLAIRLEHVRQLLADPAHMRRSISDLAYASGFGDLSYFNQSFRRRFQLTPSETRKVIPQSAAEILTEMQSENDSPVPKQ